MTFRTLIVRSLRHRWRAHLGVVLGAAVGSAALIGALIVGDSVRGSLHETALSRIGRIAWALHTGERTISESISFLGGPTEETKVLHLRAVASARAGAARANDVNLYGVRPNFWDFAQTAPAGLEKNRSIRPGTVLLNQNLADQLGVRPGDEILLRMARPGLLPQEATLAPRSEAALTRRLTVAGVVGPNQLGNFSLKAEQVPPLNAFIGLEEIQRAATLTNRVNLVLTATGRELMLICPPRKTGLARWIEDLGLPFPERLLTFGPKGPRFRKEYPPDVPSEAIVDALELVVEPLPAQRAVALSTRRVFLDPPLVSLAGSNAAAGPGTLILTYLVNQFRAGTNSTPYSMVTAAGPPWTPPNLRDDEIVINQWLADDLQAGPGDSVTLTYFVPDSATRLTERTNTFRVRAVVPLAGVHADRTLMPEFPGIARAESTHEWDAGFPLVHKIRDKDDQYWKQHRGTPKAFITLAAGQKMWANRFGELTSIRWAVPANTTAEALARAIQTNLLSTLIPWNLGLRFEPVRERALAAANQSQDFGGLFIGFSLFLIAAALILMGLLFQFGLEQRTEEIGTLLALGFTPRQVRRLLLGEGTALALLGGGLGTAGGLGYAWLMLRGLTTVWRDAVGTAALGFHVTPTTIVIGLGAAVAVSALTIWIVLRRQAGRPARELLAGEGVETEAEPQRRDGRRETTPAVPPAAAPQSSRARLCGTVTVLAALGLVVWAVVSGDTANAGIFFGAGALWLMAGLALAAVWLRGLGAAASGRAFTIGSLAVRGCTRRWRRTLAVAALLACGVFIIASIGVFRLDADAQAWKRASGTGGFALFGQSALPVVKDLNTREGREFYGLDEKDLAGVSFVPFRVREGDDASCLNLNRAQQPRLLGVEPERLAARGAFRFAKLLPAADVTNGWLSLNTTSAGRTVPAIGDAASIQWALGKKIGDTLDYTDERGQTFKLRLVGAVANSILQGNLVIAEAEFLKRFPSESGYRMFLVDAPSNRLDAVSAALSRGLQDVGLELTPAARRLAQFNAVQNTYLGTFQVLGGLGLLLGSAGLGVLVLRNALERRAELALWLAVGFRRRQVHRLVLGEHVALLALGLAVGLGSAVVAVLPALLTPTTELPWGSLAATLAGVLGTGLAATALATRAALRGELLAALRNE